MIRKAKVEDLKALRSVFDEARERMYESGNRTQWTLTYPEDEILLSDIEKGFLYAEEIDGELIAAFTVMEGIEKSYDTIFDGSWPKGDYSYVTIHRVAGKNKADHVLKKAIAVASSLSDVVRIDTHADNKKMQALIKKYGFTYCGMITLSDGSLRLSFQKGKI